MDRKSNSFKGFTLIELVVVIAIIGILAGIMSVVMNGFARDNRLETNNAKAKVIYDAFQDILIDCEVKQDCSMFDVRQELPAHPELSVDGVVMFFRIAGKSKEGVANISGNAGIGDEIHIMTKYASSDPIKKPTNGGLGGDDYLCSGSIWAHGTTQNVPSSFGYNTYLPDGGSELWSKWETAVSGRLDETIEGTFAVMIDMGNYEVKSVISRELTSGVDPKMGMFSDNAFESDNPLWDFAPEFTTVNGSEALPLKMVFIKNISHQRNIAGGKKKDGTVGQGIYIGCYPFYDDVYDGDTYPTIPNAS